MVVLISIFYCAGVVTAGQTIISDGTWRSYDQEIQGWESLSFDDSGWRNAYVNYPPFRPTIGGAQIWDWPYSEAPSGMSGPDHVWFRKEFTLDSPFGITAASLRVDDDFDFYINGSLIASNWDNTAAYVWTYDITPYLRSGENIIAIHAADLGDYEHLEYYSTVSVAPEPVGSILFVTGGTLLAGRSCLKRKRRKHNSCPD